MLDGNGLFFDGQKPFLERVDVAEADSDLARALATVRDRIDAEFGEQDWANVSRSRYLEGHYATCKSDGLDGRYTARDEGLTFGLADENFPRVLQIVREAVEPLGYTHVVDSTDEAWFYIDIFNVLDGGYVHLMMARGKGLILQVNTGCRPWAEETEQQAESA